MWSCRYLAVVALCIFSTNVSAAIADSNNCGLLETTDYHLDVSCIRQRKAQSVMHTFKGSTKEECIQACCNWSEGPCDVVYWDHSKTCLIMSYYVIAICPLLTVAIPITYSSQDSSFVPSQYVMMRIDNKRAINIELKKHLRIKYQTEIKSILNCAENDALCSNWECIDSRLDCNGVDDCSDGSDEMDCLNINRTRKVAHCVDKHGAFVYPGSYFERTSGTDPCEKCRCLSDGSAACTDLLCAITCVIKPGTCCECDENYVNGDSYINLSSTQRLVVSCMSVLAVISMLLFFSRNILQRRNSSRSNINVSWFNRREGRFQSSLGNMGTEMEQYSGYNGQSDLPPPYVLVKPPEASDSESAPPPSYEQVTEEQIQRESDDRRGDNETEPEAVAAEEDSLQEEEEEVQPQSPLSISSEAPLIQQNNR